MTCRHSYLAAVLASALAACGGVDGGVGGDAQGRSQQAVVGVPSVSVTGVTVTSPVVRSTAEVQVSAAVSAVFDVNSETSAPPKNTNCRQNNNFCGTGNPAVTDQTVETRTSVVVSNTSVAASAAHPGGSGVALTSATGTTFSGALAPPVGADDGSRSVVVTATASEVVSTTVTVVTTNKNCPAKAPCTVVSTTTVPTTTTETRTASGSASGAYLLDLQPGVLSVFPDHAPDVKQGQVQHVHTKIENGSADTAYRLTDTVTGPGGATYFAETTDTFQPSPGDGISNVKTNTLAVKIACDAPVGEYAISSSADTVDLAGNRYDPLTAQGGTFTVSPGQFLSSQTVVLSELPPAGDYGKLQCFTNRTNPKGKLISDPGSVHVAAVVTTTGPCAGVGTITPGDVVLTLPTGFAFADTGNSPRAHVFVGEAGSFDFHGGAPLVEVTSLVTQDTTAADAVVVHLGDLGPIPSSSTIYVRAHARSSAVATPDQPVVFSSSASATSDGGGALQDASTATVVGNPTAGCVDGILSAAPAP
jgi:hypothetical protein